VKNSSSGELLHTDQALCLNVFDSQKPMTSQLKSLPPDKQNNKLFAELLALKMNVGASVANKFPNGLGELTYNDPSDESNPFNGQMINTIIAKIDSLIGCLSVTSKLTPPSLDDAYGVLHKINETFSDSTIDTASFGTKTVFTGVRSLTEVDYLYMTPGVIPKSVLMPDVMEYTLPTLYALAQNYPNPFNPSTTITVELSLPSIVTVKIYNMLGQEVGVLLQNEQLDEGAYEYVFNAENLASGVYFYRLTGSTIGDEDEGSQTFAAVKKMMLLR
jgi:hypothetical protein